MRYQRRRSERPELDVAADQIVDRLATAAIGHLLKRDAGDLREPFYRHMFRRSRAAPTGSAASVSATCRLVIMVCSLRKYQAHSGHSATAKRISNAQTSG